MQRSLHPVVSFLSASFALLSLVAADAARAEHHTLIGWHPAGEVAYVLVEGGRDPVVRACRVNGNDLPSAWPAALAIGPGVLCADLSDDAAGGRALDFARHEVAEHKPQKAAPWGVKVALETNGTQHTVVVSDAPEHKITLAPVDSATPLTLGEVQWHKDGRFFAAALQENRKPKKGEPPAARVVVFGDLSPLLVDGPAAHKLAAARLQQAEALMKKRDWSGASKLLDDAITAAGDFASARYARAAAEAQSGVGRSAMIEQLTWLKEHATTDASVKKLLDKARTDAAFDAWCGEPELRELIGLPSVATMDAPSRLLERTGVWSMQGSSCRNPWVTLTFKKGGALVVDVAESCKGKKTKQQKKGAWAQKDGVWRVSMPTLEVGTLKLPAASTVVLDDTYQQLKLRPDGDVESIGTFEPGVAQLEDSQL